MWGVQHLVLALHRIARIEEAQAGFLETTRTWVYETLYRFFCEGFAGMPDMSRAKYRSSSTRWRKTTCTWVQGMCR